MSAAESGTPDATVVSSITTRVMDAYAAVRLLSKLIVIAEVYISLDRTDDCSFGIDSVVIKHSGLSCRILLRLTSCSRRGVFPCSVFVVVIGLVVVVRFVVIVGLVVVIRFVVIVGL